MCDAYEFTSFLTIWYVSNDFISSILLPEKETPLKMNFGGTALLIALGL